MSQFYITQTFVKSDVEYEPLYLMSFDPITWSGDKKHAHIFPGQASAEAVMLSFPMNPDFIYTLTSVDERDMVEWKRTTP